MAKILVIDDDREVCETIRSLVSRMRLESDGASTLSEGLEKLRESDFDVVFLDVRLPDGNGLDALPAIKQAPSGPEVIILTGQGDPDGAELAIQGGVWDYLVKPSSIKNTKLTLIRALQYRREKLANKGLVALNLDQVVGKSPIIRKCYDLVAQAARSDANVLITGETGTGKELFARTIHANSARETNEFVVVDCASLTESLLESILFGHKRGTFTGAEKDRIGLVKQADKGTLFLDEVGELPLSTQKAFLRVLQERRFRPVGGSREEKSDFRLVAATNRNLAEMVEKGEFRQDLYYRLKTISLELPPLRERLEDIKPLTLFYLNQLSEKHGVPQKAVDPDFYETLGSYDWPGNVRELFNTLERAFVSSGEQKIMYAMHLPQDIRINVAKRMLESETDRRAEGNEPEDGNAGQNFLQTEARSKPLSTLREFKSEMERVYLERLILETGGEVKKMLEMSGLSRSHFYAVLKKNDITL
jgi:two-component system NtrC family response regulator